MFNSKIQLLVLLISLAETQKKHPFTKVSILQAGKIPNTKSLTGGVSVPGTLHTLIVQSFKIMLEGRMVLCRSETEAGKKQAG